MDRKRGVWLAGAVVLSVILVLFLNRDGRIGEPPAPPPGPAPAKGADDPPQPVEGGGTSEDPEPSAFSPSTLAGGPPVVLRYAGTEDRPDPPPPPASPVRTIRGRIVRQDGKPVVKPHVTFIQLTNSGWHRSRGKVAEDGAFEIEVPADLIRDSVKVDAGAEGFLTQNYPFPSRALDVRELRVVLESPVRFRGRFLDEAGKPVAGSRLWAFFTPWESIGVTSDAEGRFTFLAPARHRLLMNVEHASAPPDQFQLPHLASGEADLGDIRVIMSGTIRGRVLTPEGTPLAGAEVVLVSLRRRGRYDARAKTDEAGRFEIAGVGAGLHEAYTTVSGDRSARAVGLEAGAVVDLVVRPRIVVTLRPVHADTGERIALIRIYAKVRRTGAEDDHVALRVFIRLGDKAVLWVTEPGRYDFMIADPFHPAAWVNGVEIRADRENVVEVPLRPAGDE